MPKGPTWAVSDTQVRQRGERTGLDTRVVHAVNDGCSAFGGEIPWAPQLTRKHPTWELRAQA
jgi:hypothetical protein